MALRDAAYYREYRATVKRLRAAKEAPPIYEAPGRDDRAPQAPAAPLSARKVLGAFDRPFVAWDGEGVTLPGKDTGMTRWEWLAAVDHAARERLGWSRDRVRPMLDAIRAHGGIVPAIARNGKVAGEFADVRPAFLKRPDKLRPLGNVDLIADVAGVTIEELLDYASAQPLTLAAAREAAMRELRHLEPQPGEHLYTLLANSEGGYIEDPNGLSTARCFTFMRAEAARLGNVTHTIFAGGYDANMMLRDVSYTALTRLWSKGTVYAKVPHASGEWRIRYRPRKLFAVHLLGPDRFTYDRQGRRLCDTRGGLTLWDVFGFFQQSFVAACEANLSASELLSLGLGDIAAMKLRRGSFTQLDTTAVREYCFAEVRALVTLCERLRDQLRDAELKVTRWDGAGAVSAALLQREGIKVHKDPITQDADRWTAVRSAYAGGRIETCMVGHANAPCFDDDVRSAYPAAMTQLPSLRDAVWHYNAPPAGFYVARVRWDLPIGLPWYPLFYRHPSGTITFPFAGEGWYWGPEVEAAQRFAQLHGGVVDVRETYVLQPSTDVRPFAFVQAIYDTRAMWKRIGRAGEKALKLALNGLYGKQAQQVGARRGEAPPFFQLEWAGYTTSATRARLVNAAAADPWAVAMFATDGIFTTRPLPTAIADEGLGTWTRMVAEDLVLAQAGVYWFRAENETIWTPRSRGFDLRAMTDPQLVLDAWKRGASEVTVPTTRFFTLGAALAGAEGWRAWRTWQTIPRVLDVTGSSEKRLYDRRSCGPWNPTKRLVPTSPTFPLYFHETGALSTPYPLRFERAALRDAQDVELEDIEDAAL